MPRRAGRVEVPLIYLDSCVYLDVVVKNKEPDKDSGEPRWQVAAEVFRAISADRARLAASALIEAEVCCNGQARQGDEGVRELLRGWFTAPATLWTDVDRFLAREATKLSTEHSDRRANRQRTFGGADATHLAAAIRLGCAFLFTHDEGFPLGHTIEGVTVMRPAPVWPANLLDHVEEAG